MAYLQWSEGQVRAHCPLCGDEGSKGAVLATDHVLPGHPRISLLRCPACGVAFLQDLTPPDYEIYLAEQLDYYVEQGAGIDCIVAPLLRLPAGSVRRCLDVGCSFGFALDFGRHAFGWEVLGIDPSPLAEAGAVALGLPIHRCYFTADLDLGPAPFDLVLCSEILEHLAEPLPLLGAMRERLSPEGLLVLSTPNLAIVHRETDRGTLGRALSPGFHLMLYDRGALALVLEKAGFSEVRIEESPETLRAFAACSPAALARIQPAEPAPDRTPLRTYFGDRSASAPPDSALACGFAWRHFKECVNAGLYEEAAASRAVLARIYRARFGIDLDRPEEAADWLRRRPRPFNLAGVLFLSGILELNWLGRPDRAADCFAAALAAGNVLLAEQRPTGLCDGETESFTTLSRKHLPMARAATDPDRAVRELEALSSCPEIGPELLAETLAETFVRLVHAGAYEAAECLAPRVLALVEARGEADPGALDPLQGLAMLALQTGRPGEAAELFGQVHERIAQITRIGQMERSGGSAGPERADLLWSARYHQGLSLRQAGHEAPARAVLAEVAAAPVPLAQAARALLATEGR